jgi:hypothetical protein
MVSFSEHGNEYSDSIKGKEFLDQVNIILSDNILCQRISKIQVGLLTNKNCRLQGTQYTLQ